MEVVNVLQLDSLMMVLQLVNLVIKSVLPVLILQQIAPNVKEFKEKMIILIVLVITDIMMMEQLIARVAKIIYK